MKKLVIYDTSNFMDFPIGGQLTSVRNFLTYMTERQSEFCSNIILIGITNQADIVGKNGFVEINGYKFEYLPVVYRDTNLKDIKSSLRFEYLKGLFKYRKLIPHGKGVLHYIHTPEAFIQVKFCHPFSKTAIFSHGSFFNMVRGFRFFQNNKIVGNAFELFIKWMLKRADLIFVLDDDSLQQYKKYNDYVVKVNNSIILPNEDYSTKKIHDPIRLLFVGRLSKIKRVDEIIRATEKTDMNVVLTIVGDGEERKYLETIVKTDRVCFEGALKPEEVKNEMINSDILVMNSVLEGKPMTIIEAMSFGLPIISTNVGGISELVIFGQNSEMTTGETDSICNGIKAISNEYEMYSHKSLELSRLFDCNSVNKKILEILISQEI